jgi:hypothetical protein
MPMTDPNEVEKQLEITEQLVDFARTLGTHSEACAALLGAFATVAYANPCCTQMFAHAAKALSEELLQRHAQRGPAAAGNPHHLH